MKHMWKKNQIIITALAALVAVAGYLNYSGTKLGENALPASTTETEATISTAWIRTSPLPTRRTEKFI